MSLQWVWSTFDRDAVGFIGVHQLRDLVTRLGAPLGYKHPRDRWMRLVRCALMHERNIGCHLVLSTHFKPTPA